MNLPKSVDILEVGPRDGLQNLREFVETNRKIELIRRLAAIEVGIRSFDSSVGGLGGCPFAPGATGNVATEDMAFMLSEMGIETGVDLPMLLETVRFLQGILPSGGLESALFKAGLPGGRSCSCH